MYCKHINNVHCAVPLQNIKALTDDPIGSFVHDFSGLVPVSARQGTLEPPIVSSVQVGKDSILIGQWSIVVLGRRSLGLVTDRYIVGAHKSDEPCKHVKIM